VTRFSPDKLRHLRACDVDFRQLLLELGRKKVAMAVVAELCDVDVRTVVSWKNRGSKPRYEPGATILALHEHFCSSEPTSGSDTRGPCRR
jgi:hypothetical protein